MGKVYVKQSSWIADDEIVSKLTAFISAKTAVGEVGEVWGK